MKYGKAILVLSIVVCLLFGIASVCAGEANQTICADNDMEISGDDQAINQTDDLVGVDDVGGSSNGLQDDNPEISEQNSDSNKLKAGGDLLQSACSEDEAGILGEEQTGNYASLQDLIDGANDGDVITFDRNYVFTDDLTNLQKGGIAVYKNGLTIDGNGYTVDACGKSRIFSIASSDIKLININFINAYSKDGGGVIYLNGYCSVSAVNCSFMNNYARKGGSVVYGRGSSYSVSLVNCSIVNNGVEITSKGNVNVGTYGAIYSKDNYFSVSVVNCSFVNNFASKGSAIFFKNNEGDLSVVNCSFVNNSAKTDGGAIYWGCSNGAGYFVNCSFVNNSAKNGGAIYGIFGRNTSFVDCGFASNSAWVGGAVYLRFDTSSLLVVNCDFVNNPDKSTNGGAIFVKGKCSVSLVNCSFVNNSVKSNSGGAVYISILGNSLSVVNCSFVNNSVKSNSGGAVYWTVSSVTSVSVVNCSFVNNSVGGNKGCGGAIFCKGSKKPTSVVNCSFVNNSAGGNNGCGGAIYWSPKDSVSVVNCSFVNNSAGGNKGCGGAFYLAGSSHTAVSVVNCCFMSNSAGMEAGAICIKDSKMGSYVVDCSFVNNSVVGLYHNGFGGAISLKLKHGSVENCNFVNNFVVGFIKKNYAIYGGAIYLKGDGSSVKNCVFVNNHVTNPIGNDLGKSSFGGAIYSTAKKISVKNCTFANNFVNESGKTRNDGGAIYLDGDGGSVSDCSFVNNSVFGAGDKSGGGAIYFNGGGGSVSDCSFVNNSVSGDGNESSGGAINWAGSKGSLHDCIFMNNSVSGEGNESGGGAICWASSSGSIYRCNFVSNEIRAILNSVDYENCSLVLTLSGSGGKNNHVDTIYLKKRFHYNGNYFDKDTEITVESTVIVNLNNIGVAVEVYCEDSLADNVTLLSGSNGNVTYDYSKLPAGNYEYRAYAIDHDHVSVAGNFTRDYIKTNLAIAVSDVTYGEYPVVNLTSDASGNYSIVVDGKSYGVYELNESNNHQLSITVPVLLNAGNGYRASVEFNGNAFHAPANDAATFNVEKALPDFNVASSETEYEYGQDVVCLVDLPDDATGSVTFHCLNEIIGEIADASQQDSLNIAKLDVGQYVIQVIYAGDGNYRNSTKEFAFNITPKDNLVEIGVAGVTYPDEVTLRVGATVDGVYTVDINGMEYDVTANADGITLKLAAGTYCASVVNVTMKNHNIISANSTFTVEKAVNSIVVSVGDVVLPDDVVVSVEADVDGVYTVVVNGTSVDVNVVKGSGNASIALSAGESYIASTSFVHENYTANIVNAVFDVVKGINTVNVTVDDVDYPNEVTVKVNADVGGVYTVDINGTEYDVDVGVAKSLKLAAGTYYARVVGYSSPDYEAVIRNATFTVGKAVNKIVVGVDDTVLPGNVTVCVEAGLDDVYTVMINATSVDVTVVKGAGNASICLPAGESYLATTSFAHENYTANITKAVFDVVKSINTVNVTVIVANNSDLVTVIVSADVFDTYTVDINGTEYYVPADGEGILINLPIGDYHANVVGYSSDYYEAVIRNATFTVKKPVNNVVVSVDDVVLPDDCIVCVSADVDGIYTVVINGTSVDVAVVDGRGNVSIALPAGRSYHADTTFDDWENYTVSITNAVFDVVKGINTINVTVVFAQNSDEVNIIVTADIAGLYTVDINGTEYYIITTPEGMPLTLDPGTYYARVVGYSSDYYEAVINNATFTVSEALTK